MISYGLKDQEYSSFVALWHLNRFGKDQLEIVGFSV